MTLGRSQPTLFSETELPLMSSAVASPAKTLASLETELALKVRALVSGPSTRDSLASYDPATSSWRTCQACLVSGWETFSESWPRSGTMLAGTAYPLAPSAPLTYGIGFGSSPTHSIPTPTTQDHIERKSTSSEKLNFDTNKTVSLDRFVKMWPTPRGRQAGADFAKLDRSSTGISLETAVRIYPTPRASDAERGGRGELLHVAKGAKTARGPLWPTPQAHDYKSGAGYDHGDKKQTPQLRHIMGGQLNPTWVEWLMGFPLGWTDCGPSETRSSRKLSK
jgi:hypothetical protein